MSETTLKDACGVLNDSYNSDTPTTGTAASQLAKQVNKAGEVVREWMGDLADAVDSVIEAADEVADADPDDREDAHTSLIEALDTALHELRRAMDIP